MSAMLLGVLGLVGSMEAFAQEGLPEGWVLHSDLVDARSISCSEDTAAIRSWFGEVHVFDGRDWTELPEVLRAGGQRGAYGNHIAVAPSGELFLDVNRGLGHWDGKDWTLIEASDWEGPIGGMAVLGSGDLVLVGYGRIGLLEDGKIQSFAAGTWRELNGVGGRSLVDLWTVGQGGTWMHHGAEGWSRQDTETDAWLSGLLRCGEDCAWAWNVRRDDWGGGTATLRRWSGTEWTDQLEGIDGTLVGLAGDGERPWAATEETVYRFDGSTWKPVVQNTDLGEGWHRFVGICATEDAIIVADSARQALVRER
jgi:hypothetical protein